MKQWIISAILLQVVALAGRADEREGRVPDRFAVLVDQAEQYIDARERDVIDAERQVADSQGRAKRAAREAKELDREVQTNREVLSLVDECIANGNEDAVLVLGGRRYRMTEITENVTLRRETVGETEMLLAAKRKEVEERQKRIEEQKGSIQRIRQQLTRARTVLAEQQNRRRDAQQGLAIAELERTVCPDGDLLFASGTELGAILGAIEEETSALEALLEIRKPPKLIDLRKHVRTDHKRKTTKDVNNE